MESVFQRIFSAAIAVAIALCGGCAVQNAFLGSDTAELEFAAADTEPHAIAVDSSSPWVVDNNRIPSLWLGASYDADDVGLLWVRASTVNESLYARRDSVRIVSADARALNIYVTQREMAVSLDVTPDAPEPFGPRDATTRTLAVATDLVSWEFLALGGEWLTVERAEGTKELTLSAKSSNQLDERRDTVVVRPVNETFRVYSDSIPVVQLGLDLAMTSDAMDDESFDVAIPAAGGEVTASVYSRAAWTLSTDADPERVSVNIAEGEADTENGVPIVITAAENGTAEEYSFTLTFASGDETYTYTCRQRAAVQ